MLQPPAQAFPAVLLLALAACSPPAAEEFSHEPVCGEPGPKRLLDLPPAEDYEIVGPVGDRILVVTSGDSTGQTVHAVGPCGEDPVTFEVAGYVRVKGDWVLSYSRSEGELVYHDVRTGEQRLLLTDVHSSMAATPLGLVVPSRAGGPLLLHPDPSDPSAEPVTLLEQTASLEDPAGIYRHLVWADDTQTFGIDPDGVVHRIDLATGTTEPVVTGATNFTVVDGGAQLVYSSDRGTFLSNIDTGDELLVDANNIGENVAFVKEAHDWMLFGKLFHLGRHEVLDDPGLPFFETILPAVDGSVIGLETVGLTVENENDFWRLQDDGSFEKIVDHRCRFGDERFYGLPGIVYPDGVAIPSNCLEELSGGDERPDDLTFFPLEGEPYVVGRSFGLHTIVSEHVISFELDEPNRLLVDAPDEEPQVAAFHVRATTLPVEEEDLFYVAGDGLYRMSLGL